MQPPTTTDSRQARAIVLISVAILTILVFHLVCPTDCPSKWNQIHVHRYIIHLHHWLLCVIFLIILACIPILRDSAVLAGFLVGGLVHGLTYPDWYVVCLCI